MTMKKPTKAILDGDIIAWKTAFVVETEGYLSIDSLLGSVIKKWTPKKCKDVKIALSCDSKDNFRKDVFPGYKENRAAVVKPEFLGDVFQALEDQYECLRYPKLEADDILGIHSSSGDAISVSIDKDLKGVPGWYYNPEKNDEPYYISEEEAEEWFCVQWMAGDSTDGIPGLWRIGKKKAEKFLDEWDRDDWYNNIIELYTEGKHVPENKHEVDDMCTVMGQCVRILRHDNYNMETNEINYWCPKVGL